MQVWTYNVGELKGMCVSALTYIQRLPQYDVYCFLAPLLFMVVCKVAQKLQVVVMHRS